MPRPSWDEYFMGLAATVSARTTCLRRRVGAVIEIGHRVLATGYNGSPSGAPHCDEAGCTRSGLQSGEALGVCRAVHAEANAIAQAARHGIPLEGATAHVTCQPCAGCARLLIQAGIARIVWGEGYPDKTALNVLQESGYVVEGSEARRR